MFFLSEQGHPLVQNLTPLNKTSQQFPPHFLHLSILVLSMPGHEASVTSCCHVLERTPQQMKVIL